MPAWPAPRGMKSRLDGERWPLLAVGEVEVVYCLVLIARRWSLTPATCRAPQIVAAPRGEHAGENSR